ncbi:DHA2 family efflux MFS transporter permease subunit [Amycolatopsis sp. Hca4]|uniref:DHA2 family efflux MFS transporter permease subunit n=1 Tax=Amycolatopsis sp. Hca4 TaxID=2742131 RepID=UPI001590BBFC|nr:DHA2 family efflux MFS transporter permease subunit [Amycolatopsis sp. Hca4]QKV75834.1 DHA2 family efflux MFS transporter permease subunit [Amycolatopsis sp. Hca4]
MSLFARTFAITSSAWFLFALDRLAVTTALPVLRTDLGAGLAGAEWTVNAYTLSFAVLLLAGAALGDRFGRRRVFAIGLAVFTAGSAAAALAPDVGTLVAARAVQGAGGAVFAPLSLTLLSAAAPAARRGAVLGAWGGVGGLGVVAGPLLGGALTSFAGWPWIFWLNVPLGLVLVPVARRYLRESHGPHGRLDLRGVALSGAGVFGVVWAVIRAGGDGWARPDVLVALVSGVLALVLFVAWETRAPAPMLPMRFFRHRAFAAANLTALLKYAALFGGLFLVTHLLQTGLTASPLEAGLRMLPMVVMPMLLTPLAGVLSDRWGTRPLLALGVGLVATGLAWLAAVTAPGVGYGVLVPGLVVLGTGSALFFAPAAATVLGAVAPDEQGQASGATTAVREIAVVLGVAVLASVFAAHGDLGSPARLVDGVVPALWVGAALAGAGVLATLALPRAGSLRVRVALADDHATIREVLGAAYAQYAGEISPAVWDAYRADLLDLDRHARLGQLLVAEVGGKIAGYAAFYPDATVQNLGWPGGWASGRGMGVHPGFRGRGVADALMAALEDRARASGAPVFAFHTSGFMTAALALYARLGYRRAPEFDRDMNAHYGLNACRPWPALAYRKDLPTPTGGTR